MVFVNRCKLVSHVPIAQSVEQWGSWHEGPGFKSQQDLVREFFSLLG